MIKYSKRIEMLDTSVIREVFSKASTLKNPIDLSIGKPHFPTPKLVIEAYQKALQDGHTAYSKTQGILALREILAKKYLCHPDQVLLSAGIAPLLHLLFMSIIEAKDTILISEPSFLIYKSMIPFFEANEITLPETFTPDQLENLTKNSKIKMILLANPSNPSGYIYSRQQLHALVEFARKHQILLVIDEIYCDFDYDKKFLSLSEYFSDQDLPAIILAGFSKSYSMTGLRLGMAVGHLPTIQRLTKLQQYSIVCAPTPCQYAGITTLTKVNIKERIDYYRNNRKLCLETLATIQPQLKFTYPSGAFYIFFRLPTDQKPDVDFVKMALEQKKLLLIPGYIFCNTQDYCRLSYAVDRNILKQGLSLLKDLLK